MRQGKLRSTHSRSAGARTFPLRTAGVDAVLAKARESDADIAMFDYPGRGRLFPDPSLTDDFDPWARVLGFGALAG